MTDEVLNKYRVCFYVPLVGFEEGIRCYMEFETGVSAEDAYAVGEQIIRGIKSVNYGWTELV